MRGHHSASITRRKVYESGFYWPSIFKDAKDYVMRCDACQILGNISSRSEMPQNNIQIYDAYWISLNQNGNGMDVVKTVHPYGTVEIINKNGISFKVNRQRLKKYHDGHIDAKEKEVVELGDDTTSREAEDKYQYGVSWGPRERNIDEYWWRIYKSEDLEVLES
ncbi:reverse transcriptase domain-containing protein [Tanacetum coccineum]